MTSPTIGVALSLYNQGQFVDEALQSLLDQSRQPDEIVVVDDGSTDDGPPRVEQYESHGVKLLRLKRQGVSRVLNSAVEELTTDFIAIQACDDASEPERLEWQAEILQQDNPPAVFSLPHVVNEDSVLMPRSFAAEFFHDLQNEDDPLKRLFTTGNWLCASSAFMPRQNFLIAGQFHPALLHLQDFLLWIRLAHLGKLHIINEPLVRYRRNSRGGNLSSPDNDARMRAEMQFVYNVFFEGCDARRVREAFDGVEEKADLIDLYLEHPVYLVKQAGLDLMWRATDLSDIEASDQSLLPEPFDFFEKSSESDIDRQQVVANIYAYLNGRQPWRLP